VVEGNALSRQEHSNGSALPSTTFNQPLTQKATNVPREQSDNTTRTAAGWKW